MEDFEDKLLKIEKKIDFLQVGVERFFVDFLVCILFKLCLIVYIIFEGALVFALEMENCLEVAVRSVMTGQAGELGEIIKLLVEASKFEIKGSSKAIRELFRVVWKRDSGVQDVLVNAAKDLFVSSNE